MPPVSGLSAREGMPGKCLWSVPRHGKAWVVFTEGKWKKRKIVIMLSRKQGNSPTYLPKNTATTPYHDRKMGQDGHDRGAKVVATGYADVGFDVDIGPYSKPSRGGKTSHRERRTLFGVSSLAAGHKTLVPQVIAELKNYGCEDTG